MNATKPTTGSDPRRAANLRTAAVFGSIAAVFFGGIIVAHAIGGPVVGIGVMGAAVLLFLGFAIGRSLRVSEGGESQGPKGASPSERGGRPLGAVDPARTARRPQQ
jgi:hypothetical protein